MLSMFLFAAGFSALYSLLYGGTFSLACHTIQLDCISRGFSSVARFTAPTTLVTLPRQSSLILEENEAGVCRESHLFW